MNLNSLFTHQQISMDVRKKVEKGSDFLFPKIYTSGTKNQRQNHKRKINSDKDLYISSSNKKNLSNATNVNFYSANPKDLINSKLKPFEFKDPIYSDKIKQAGLRKVTNLQLQKYDEAEFDQKLINTQRPLNKFRKTLMGKGQSKINAQYFITTQNSKLTKKAVGNYLITKELGHGGFAKVYQAVHKETNIKYALKQYILAQTLQCYQKEAKVGQFFFKNGTIKDQFSQSPGAQSIIKFIQKTKNNKKGYIIQEIGGLNFSKLLSEIKGAFHNKQRVYEVKFLPFYEKMKNNQFFTSVITQICEGVQLLNKSGFVHCDLKLQNILVDFKDNQSSSLPIVKLIDFGSTFEIDKGLPKITITPEYMPPELLMQFDKNGNIVQDLIYDKIDVWSIGCILLQIFTGVPLWFRYKCKICTSDKSKIELGIFALTNRDYPKIVKKQQQLCDSLVKSIGFVSHEWEKYRGLLKRIFVMNPEKRISIEQLILKVKEIK